MSYGRKVIVEFITPQGLKRLKDIDVKFDVNLAMGAVNTWARISILNLNREDIALLTGFGGQWVERRKRKRIRLFAGYDDTELALIFDGDIINAIPTQPPNVWLHCEAISGAYGSTQMFSRSILVPSNINSVINQAAGWMGLTLDWQSDSKKIIEKFDFTGGKTLLMESIAKLGNIIPFEEDGKLVVVDRDAPRRDGPIRDEEIRIISEQTGMVMVPKIDYVGMEATIFLDTRIRRGDSVKLESKTIPSANGPYYVRNLRHHGHLRGISFYTEIKAWRRNTYEPNPT